MDQLQLNTHSSHRNKFICCHKNQEKKLVHIAEGLAVACDPRALALVDGNVQFHTENPGGQINSFQFHFIMSDTECKTERRSLNVQVTHRVIPVSDQILESRSEVGEPVNVTGSLQSFSDGGSRAGEGDREEARRVCFPASPVRVGTAASHTTGQFYVMMTPSDALLPRRTTAPRMHTYTVKMDSPRTPRDERRRAQHNEVERRRRDKINNWIVTLSKMIPDCGVDVAKTAASKGGILSKACDYIGELKQHKQRLQESLRRAERVQMDNELLRQQLEELKSENGLLRAQLEHHGIDMFPQ